MKFSSKHIKNIIKITELFFFLSMPVLLGIWMHLKSSAVHVLVPALFERCHHSTGPATFPFRLGVAWSSLPRLPTEQTLSRPTSKKPAKTKAEKTPKQQSITDRLRDKVAGGARLAWALAVRRTKPGYIRHRRSLQQQGQQLQTRQQNNKQFTITPEYYVC